MRRKWEEISLDEAKNILKESGFIRGGPHIWRKNNYYRASGSTYLTNWTWIYTRREDLDEKYVCSSSNNRIAFIIRFIDYPDNVNMDGNDEWWIVDMLNCSLLADKLSMEEIVKNILRKIKAGILHYQLDRLTELVEKNGLERTKRVYYETLAQLQ